MDNTQEDMGPDEASWYRVDLHVHARWSPDAIGDLDQLARAARSKGLNAIALTEHDTTDHHAAIRNWNREHKKEAFLFFPGTELSTKEGHLLAIGIQTPVRKGLPLDETIERVKDAGGVAIPAHPYRWRTGIGKQALAQIATQVHLVETWNAQENRKKNHRAHAFAEHHGLGSTGGSDAHQVHDVGNGHTLIPQEVEDLDGLLQALETRRTRSGGSLTPRKTRLRQRVRIAYRRATFRYRRQRGEGPRRSRSQRPGSL